MLYYMQHHRTGLSPQYSPVLSPVLTRDKVCDAGAKSLKTLECSREKPITLLQQRPCYLH